MQIILRLCFLLLVLPATSYAEPDSVHFEGEKYLKQYDHTTPVGDRVIEFIRQEENTATWSKMVAFRYQQLPKLNNDPQKMAEVMAVILKRTNPEAPFNVIANQKKDEALIDFITWDSSDDYLEFNVFRYARSENGKGVISLQVAYRFTDKSKKQMERLRSIRARWIPQALEYDITIIRQIFEK